MRTRFPEQRARFFETGDIPVGKREDRAFARQRHRKRTPDAGGGSRDDADPILDFHDAVLES